MSETVLWTSSSPSIGRAVAALGVFDGVHLGHQALVHDAVRLAESQDAASVVLTFDRDPDQVVTPAAAAPQLLDLADKLEYLSDLGPDVLLVVPFDEHLASLAPLSFMDEILMPALEPVAVVVGYDFRFGHRAEGDVDVLVRYGASHDFTVVAHDLVRHDGEPVTSTRIRRLLAAGRVQDAAQLLGRPHRLKGRVVRGRGDGASLGAPTANLEVGEWAALPADGVYAGRATVDGRSYPAAISVGRPPSFPEATYVLEAHLIGFEGDLYGSGLVLEFVERLRDQQGFDSPDELARAIASDVERTRELPLD